VSVLDPNESKIATTDLSVRYLRAITPATGRVTVIGSIVHRGRTTVIAEASLFDQNGKTLAIAQSTSIAS